MSVSKLDRLKRELKSAISEGDYELALEVVNDMIDIDEESPKFWNSRGVVLSKLGRIDESLENFDNAIVFDDSDPKIWFSKGCVLMDNGKLRAGLGCFYKALDLDPSMDKARERFLRCLDLMKEYMEKSVEEEHEEEEETMEEPSSGQEIYHEMPTPDSVAQEAGEYKREKVEDQESLEVAESIRRKKEIRGTFLDEDMFQEEDDDWSDIEEQADEEAEEEEDVWDEDEAEGDVWDEEEAEDEEEPEKVIRCKCGASIPIYTKKRPTRFECPECGRTGTLGR